MAKILGLDLGTNSIGWAIVEYYKENNIQFKLLDKGVLIFDAGVLKDDKGKYKSKTAERTNFRGIRRLKFRLKIRKYETLKALIKYGMCPLDIAKLEVWKSSNFEVYPTHPDFINWLRTDNFGDNDNLEHKRIRQQQIDNPYFLRDKALKTKLSNFELGRVFYHLAQRRGFLSNRLDKTDDTLLDTLKDKIKIFIEENKLEIIKKEFDELFEEFDIEKSSELNATELKIKSIKKNIELVFNNKVKDKSFETFEDIINGINDVLGKRENLGPVKKGIKDLDIILEKENFKTIGQYFYSIYNKEKDVSKIEGEKLIVSNAKIRNHYTARETHYEVEFDLICKHQNLNSNQIIDLKKANSFNVL